MKIYLAADHGGYKLKEELKPYLKELGYKVEDIGNHALDPNDDYPNFVIPLAQKLAQNPQAFGIIIGRSGNGESIAANKVKGVRAVLATNEEMAKKARSHNNANILSLGADFMEVETAKKVVMTFLKTPFSQEERHIRRLEKISEFEETSRLIGK